MSGQTAASQVDYCNSVADGDTVTSRALAAARGVKVSKQQEEHESRKAYISSDRRLNTTPQTG